MVLWNFLLHLNGNLGILAKLRNTFSFVFPEQHFFSCSVNFLPHIDEYNICTKRLIQLMMKKVTHINDNDAVLLF